MTDAGRSIIVIAAVIFGLIVFGVWDQDQGPYFYHTGKAQSCSGGALFTDAQAEIVEYGLQDPRGISADQTRDRVFIVEANRHIVVYNEDSGKAGDAFTGDNLEFMCPDGRCDDMDARDVVIDGPNAYVAEYGKGRLFKGTVGKDGYLIGMNPDETDIAHIVLSPSGVGVSAQELAITGEAIPEGTNKPKGLLYIFPKPRKEQREGAQNQFNRKGNEDQQKSKPDPQPASHKNDANPTRGQQPPNPAISTGLHRPSGVVWDVWDESRKYVYVADDDDADDAVRWSIFKKQEQDWVPLGFLASVSKMHRSMPKFLGIALEHKKQIIFAAGPMGLYAFTPDGASIGTMLFDEPVSGVALTNKYLYLIVGHMLCRICLHELAEQEKKIKVYEPSTIAPLVKAAADCAAAKSGHGQRLSGIKVRPRSRKCECLAR